MVTLTFVLCLISNSQDCNTYTRKIDGGLFTCALAAQQVIAEELNKHPDRRLKKRFSCSTATDI